MYRLLIIDDQKYVIDGITEFIDQNTILVAGTAFNGVDGLKKIISLRPDIVITDIGMPKMTGLDMIKEAKKSGCTSKFILLTGHENFEFAKKAIDYDIVSYILKPAMPKDILNAIQKAVKLIAAEDEMGNKILETQKYITENLPFLREKFIDELISGDTTTEAEFIDKVKFFSLNFKDKAFRCITVEIHGYDSLILQKSELERQTIKFQISEAICSALRLDGSCTNFKNHAASFILPFRPDREDEFEDDNLANILYDILSIIEKNFSISISIGVGNIANSFHNINTSCKQSYECLKYFFYHQGGHVIFYNDIIYTQVVNPILETYDRSGLTDAIKMRNIPLVRSITEASVLNFKNLGIINSEYLKMIAHEMISVIISTLHNMGESGAVNSFDINSIWQTINQTKSIKEINDIFVGICERLENDINTKKVQNNSRVVEQMIEYAKQNYQNDISLKTLSKHIYLTPNYLNMIFTNQMGMTYKNYLTKFRIDKAKELLSENKYMVYEISEMVGYKNLDYFRKLFKEHTGSNPSDFSK